MPMGTLTLPRSMIDAAETYAERENLSVADLFANLLRRQYGYVISAQIVKPAKPIRNIKISARVHSLRGVAKLSDSRSYEKILEDAITEKYENL